MLNCLSHFSMYNIIQFTCIYCLSVSTVYKTNFTKVSCPPCSHWPFFFRFSSHFGIVQEQVSSVKSYPRRRFNRCWWMNRKSGRKILSCGTFFLWKLIFDEIEIYNMANRLFLLLSKYLWIWFFKNKVCMIL